MHQSGRPDAGFPSSLVPVAARIEERIRDLLDGELARWRAVDPALAEPLTTLRAFVDAGGKRLRPAFCHCAFIGAGGDPQDKAAIDAGAALELVHTFALLHDDVMDGSDRRRGVDAVHHDFALRHERHGGRGEARRYGEGIAILVGDFAFVYADQLMRDAPGAALDIFDELRIELCVGQSLDLMGTAAASTDAELAHRIARFKSGKYTVERPLHLGAALAGRLDARSVTSRQPESRWATTCAKENPRRSLRSRRRVPRQQINKRSRAWVRPTSRPRMSKQSKTCSSAPARATKSSSTSHTSYATPALRSRRRRSPTKPATCSINSPSTSRGAIDDRTRNLGRRA